MQLRLRPFILAILNLIAGIYIFLFYQEKVALSTFEILAIFVFIFLALFGLIIWFYLALKIILAKETKETSKTLSDWSRLKLTFDFILIAALAIRFFLIQPFYVSGLSMEPNIHNGDLLLVEKLSYYFREPERGEIIIFRYPQNPSKIYIKRIVGLPGEKIEIKDGKVIIHTAQNPEGLELKESYLEAEISTLGNQSQLLGEDEFFVLGDNRWPNQSSDSREWGPVPRKNILGHSWLRFWPPPDLKIIPLPQYNLGQFLPILNL